MGKMSLTSCRALSTPGKFSNVDRYGSLVVVQTLGSAISCNVRGGDLKGKKEVIGWGYSILKEWYFRLISSSFHHQLKHSFHTTGTNYNKCSICSKSWWRNTNIRLMVNVLRKHTIIKLKYVEMNHSQLKVVSEPPAFIAKILINRQLLLISE